MVKAILQIYPVLPAASEEEDETLRHLRTLMREIKPALAGLS